MSENEVHPRHAGACCAYAWCTTRHGLTIHPDDEAHRSSGSGFAARVRGSDEAGAGRETQIEVGVLRRPGDVENWLAIEVGSAGLTLSIDGARELRRVLAEDPQIREALSS